MIREWRRGGKTRRRLDKPEANWHLCIVARATVAAVMPIMDVVVQITGFGGTESALQGRQQNSDGLRSAIASPTYAGKSNRRLTTIVYKGGQNPDPSQVIAVDVRTALAGADLEPGLICLLGESAGGKNVLSLASDLANPPMQVTLAFVGVADGAFTDNDAVEPPNWSGTNLLIRPPVFSARETSNIYQSAGNDTELSISKGARIWAGKMPNKEVHGPIRGFLTNRDLTKEGLVVGVGKNTSWEGIHANAVSIGSAAHLDRIKTLLANA